MSVRLVVPTLLSVALVTVAFPTVSAGDAPACSQVTDEEALTFADAYLRVTDDAIQTWMEANGLEGLQLQDCEDAEGEMRSRDTFVESVSTQAPDTPDAGIVWDACDAAVGLLGNLRCPRT